MQDFPLRPPGRATETEPRSQVRRPPRLRHSDGKVPKLCRKTEQESVFLQKRGSDTLPSHSRIAILRECICLHTVIARFITLSLWSLADFSRWQAASRAAQLLISCAAHVRCDHAETPSAKHIAASARKACETCTHVGVLPRQEPLWTAVVCFSCSHISGVVRLPHAHRMTPLQ